MLVSCMKLQADFSSDFLISFYSDGFPLDKAIAYVKARKPFCVNDVPMQKILWDRRICLRILDKINVPTPRRLEVNRDGGPSVITPELARHLRETTGVVLAGPEDGTGGQSTPPRKVELLDDGDTLSVDGSLLKKPFVEKPTSGEDHNICVYYPKSQGGGARKLFRKIGNKSSEWVDGLTIPRAITEPDSSYVYEQFMNVDNFEDVKAYTVGPNFCHAETRKSPVVDGLVRRNTHGKEIRYVTQLTKEEAAMAARIATSFGQRVCGFDLLRAGGKSYVIDVNGWSFVKDNEEYYVQCANILRKMFIREKQKKDGFTNPGSSITSSETSEAEMGPPHRKETIKEQHRSTLHNILSKSPSFPKLSNLQHTRKSKHGAASPDLNAVTAPLSSPPSVESSSTLPPPALSAGVSMPSTVPATPSLGTADSALILPPPAPKHAWKLKGMVSVIRHADRTPKQKYKFTFHTKPFIELLKGHQEEVLLTGALALDSVIDAVDLAVQEGVEDRTKLKTLRNVLVKKGGWAGTKVQIKPMFRKQKSDDFPQRAVPHIADIPVDLSKALPNANLPKSEGDKTDASPDRALTRADSLTRVTLSRITAAEESLVLDKLQLIVKWGGEPTHSARYQSQELGENMRNDLMIMNKDVLDEVHVFSSSERRVTTSAQIWAASFLDDNDLPSDFITVRKDLLDDSNAAKDEMDRVKKKLKVLLREGQEPPPQFAWPEDLPEPSVIQKELIGLMNFHRRVMRHNYNKLFGSASSSLNAITNPGERTSSAVGSSSSTMAQATATNSIQARWCCGEDAELFRERWEKLFSEFCDVEKVDPSKISELYDTMKFDALHNRQFLEWVFTPSKSLLEEGEHLARSKDDKAHDREEAESPDDAMVDKSKTLPTEKSETSKSVSGRLFRRRSTLRLTKAGTEKPPPEQVSLGVHQ
jgi:inositol-hexakisphosphate/diphosphoinositol-pentakisphosphate 1-kinase